MSRLKVWFIATFILVLLGLTAYSALAYEWRCLSMGQSVLPSYTCQKACCMVCVDGSGYAGDIRPCNALPQCGCGSGGGGGATTENIPYVTITSPLQSTYYPTSTVSLSFTVNSITSISTITYRIDSLATVTVCSGNCNLAYTINVPASGGLSDGSHTIKVVAMASDGKTNPDTSVSFFVDSVRPVISSTQPADGSNTVGSITDSFSLMYTEANLKAVGLYYKTESASTYSFKNITGCNSGTGMSCSTTLDLRGFAQCSKLNYYFIINDPFNTAQSATATIKVVSSATDTDADGLPDVCDNCPSLANPDQADLDGDKLGNICDAHPSDKDNDGIDDSSDRIQGTASNIQTDTTTPSLYLDDQPAPDHPTGTHHVEIKNGARTLVEFDMNFDSSVLDLTSARIDTQRGSTGTLLVSGLNLNGATKTVYMDRLNPGSNRICIKDAEISDLSQISGGCTGSDEYLITCDGLIHNGYNCSLFESSRYRISGLRHSGVMEYSSCTESWTCSGWDNCLPSNTQTRTCTDAHSCGTTSSKPAVSQSCTYATPSSGGGGGGGGGGSGGSSGGGGGGGGGGSASLFASESQFFPTIAAGSTGSVQITNSDKLGITAVYLKVLAPVEGAKVTVKESNLPYGFIAPIDSSKGGVYLYMQITRSEVPTESIDKVNFNFKVSKEWLTKNQYSKYDVMMVRYLETQKKWMELTTSIMREDANYIYYTAESPGFSTFAIISKVGSGVQPEVKPVVNTTIAHNQTAINQSAQNATSAQTNTTAKSGILGITGNMIGSLAESPVTLGIAIFLVIIIVMLVVIIRTGRKSVELR